jgi:2-phosphosulfolactate phosphatase
LKSVVIDHSPQSASRYLDSHAIVVVDVIRATTTLVTGLATGRRCYVACSPEDARARAARFADALLAGELGGDLPEGFHLTNSPAAVASRTDIERPLILVSSAGTQLLHNARQCADVYLACLRNYEAVAEHLAERHARVAVLGAGTRGEFREEDQMCCAWIAGQLIEQGYGAANPETARLVTRWSGAPVEAFLVSRSVDYLRRSGQLDDLVFVLAHVNDLGLVATLRDDEVCCAAGAIAEPVLSGNAEPLMQREPSSY